jgi:hypothetical protein
MPSTAQHEPTISVEVYVVQADIKASFTRRFIQLDVLSKTMVGFFAF